MALQIQAKNCRLHGIQIGQHTSNSKKEEAQTLKTEKKLRNSEMV
jgi:hypothetical protein